MSFVIGLCLFLAGIAAVPAYLLFRRRAWAALGVGALVFAGGMVWSLAPVCVPIPNGELASFDPPIETRTETGMNGQRYFQRRGGTWFHCKARIARALFF